MSSNIVIDKLTFTPTKVTLEFREDSLDPFPKKASVKKLTGNLESHVEAIAEHIVQDLRERYEEDKKQMPLGFNDEEEETDSEEQPEGYTAEDAKTDGVPFDEPEEDIHPSQIEVHYHEDTQIPDFSKIEDKHLEKFLQFRYAGEPGGYDKKDLISDIKYGYDKKIPGNLGTKSVVQAALKIIRGEV